MSWVSSSANQTKGFTLIELLVVVAIIGMLSSIVLVSLTSVRERARDTQRISDMKQFQTALELYRTAVGSYPNTSNAWSSFDSPAYSSTLVTPGNITLTAAMAPYIGRISDPRNLGGDSGYLYISSTGADYCILIWRTPENLRNYGTVFTNNARPCSSLTSSGQCVGNANSVYIGTGQYANGC